MEKKRANRSKTGKRRRRPNPEPSGLGDLGVAQNPRKRNGKPSMHDVNDWELTGSNFQSSDPSVSGFLKEA